MKHNEKTDESFTAISLLFSHICQKKVLYKDFSDEIRYPKIKLEPLLLIGAIVAKLNRSQFAQPILGSGFVCTKCLHLFAMAVCCFLFSP